MKILVDIGHPSQLNFYKNTIKRLTKKHFIYVTYMFRGSLPTIIEEELGEIQNCKLINIGYFNNPP